MLGTKPREVSFGGARNRGAMKFVVSAVALCVTALLAGCGGGGSAPGADVTIAGSTAMLPLVKQAAQDYETAHPDARVSVSGGGSRVGITQAAQKGADIGDSDIVAPDEPSLIDHHVAAVTFAVIVNAQSRVTRLTRSQIHDVFTGKVTNWKAVGGADQTISIINRPDSSGTRAVFVSNVMGGVQPLAASMTEDSSGTVAAEVAQTPGATSYVATSYIRSPQIAAVSIDGVAPTTANVIAGKYAFWSYEHMFTQGAPSKAAAAFIAYVVNDTAALNSLGFIPVSKLKAP